MQQFKGNKIFIVDDDALLLTALKDHLERNLKYEIFIFHTGEECLKHLKENPSIIILDYHLNTVMKNAANGMEILALIKKSNIDIQIIMLSSQERYSIAMQSLQKGAEHYVVKDEEAFDKITGLIKTFHFKTNLN